jgi:hypothetical protein
METLIFSLDIICAERIGGPTEGTGLEVKCAPSLASLFLLRTRVADITV